ncbi:MAG: hypothetical protein AAGC96_08810 [Pseudomonadota bacterium]
MTFKRAALVLVVFVGLTQTVSAQSADPLATLGGAWKGEGWARQKTSSAAEKVQCRIENEYFRSSQKLIVEGRCAVPGKKFTLTGSMTRKLDGDTITGRWSNPFGAGAAGVSGRQTGNRITLRFAAPHPDTGKRTTHLMIWDIEPGKFSLITSLPDEGITLSDLQFSR